MSKTCRASSSVPLIPPQSRQDRAAWGPADLRIPELDILRELGEAANHPHYSKPLVSVDRLACAGMDIGLPETYAEAKEGVFKSLQLSRAELSFGRVFFDSDGVRRSSEERRVIADALLGLAQRPLLISQVRVQDNRDGAVLSAEEAKKLLVLVLRLSPREHTQQLGDELRSLLCIDEFAKAR